MQEIGTAEVILGNSSKRFSGVTATMLACLPGIRSNKAVCVMGRSFVPDDVPACSFWDVVRYCRSPLPSGKKRVFHARRNDEMIQALFLKRLFRIDVKIVFTSTAQRFHSRFSRWLMSQMDLVISTCEAAASYLDPKPLVLIPHGVDLEKYHPAEQKNDVSTAGGVDGTVKIGIFGRVRYQKGLDIFVNSIIEVLPSHPQAEAIIVGAIKPEDQRFVAELERKLDQAGLSNRVTFEGEVSLETVPILMRNCDIVCALSRNEGFGLTVLEAMASGAAAIATKAGAWPDILRNGENGLLVEAGIVESTTKALLRLLNNSQERRLLAKAGYETVVSRYSIEHETKSLLRLYDNLSVTK